MSEKDMKIMETFSRAVPMLTDSEKERLLAYGEGIAFMAERRTQSAETPPECTTGANEGAAGRFQQTDLFVG